MGLIKVTFLPDGRQVGVPEGSTVAEAALHAGVTLELPCGGNATCGKCKVQVVSGADGCSPEEIALLTPEELAQGFRLGCTARLVSSGRVLIPQQAGMLAQKVIMEGLDRQVPLDANIRKFYLELASPTLSDQRSDLERVMEALPVPLVRLPSIDVYRDIPSRLRSCGFKATAVLAGAELIDLEPGDTSSLCYGMALDIGTTTLVGYLMDLLTGRQVAVASGMNPQVAYGDDLISRIDFASRGEHGLEILQRLVLEQVNSMVAEAAARAGIEPEQIYELTVVGNTCMTHLLLGVPPAQLAQSPYVPVFSQTQTVAAASLGVAINRRGRICVLPNIAGFVGADTVGVILASQIDQAGGLRVAIDIGTNGEVVVALDGRLLACSTAAGPAFEGARISRGMRAAAGAIDRVRIEDGVEVHTIEDAPARGICGSGLIEAVAELVRVGIVQENGRMIAPLQAQELGLPAELAGRLVLEDGTPGFVLVPASESGIGEPILLTSRDVRELQLAKGAIFAGITMLLSELGQQPSDVEELMLAGAFGNYIDPGAALAIGLIPDLPVNRVRSIGNAAGSGARIALISKSARAHAAKVAGRVEHIELANRTDFYERFAEAMALKRMTGAQEMAAAYKMKE